MLSGQRLLIYWLLVIVLCGAGCKSACSDHGHLSQGVCVCDTPFPEAGAKGYVGPSCEVPVFGAVLDGPSFTAQCPDGCNRLADDEWVCFYARTPSSGPDSAWNYLNVQLARVSAEGDPDLHGMLSDETALSYPGSANSELGNMPFREISSSRYTSVIKSVKKSDFKGSGAVQGTFLCVEAFSTSSFDPDSAPGSVEFNLFAAVTVCPGGFTADGNSTVCSTPKSITAGSADAHHASCSADGKCVCQSPYKSPVDDPFTSSGFADCSSQVSEESFDALKSSRAYHVASQHCSRGKFHFYKIHIGSDDQMLHAAAEPALPNTDDDVVLYLMYGKPPSRDIDEYIVRSAWFDTDDDNIADLSISSKHSDWQPGEWWLGVYVRGTSDVEYTLDIKRFECPWDCSGHGECKRNSSGGFYCDCNAGYFEADCSASYTPIAWGNERTHTVQGHEYDFYMISELTAEELNRCLTIVLTVTMSSMEYPMYYTDVRPELLIGFDNSSWPVYEKHALKVVLQEANVAYTLQVPSAQIEHYLKAAIYNPLTEYGVTYTLRAEKRGRCLNACSGHGDCSPEGLCSCEPGYAGGDCSVPQSTQGGCIAGTLQAEVREAQQGVCWHECVCSGDSCRYDTSSCKEFTCTQQPSQQPPLRRRGGSDECVRDECTQSEWEATDDHVCLRKCTCPADGAACTLDESCSTETFVCRSGYQAASNQPKKCIPQTSKPSKGASVWSSVLLFMFALCGGLVGGWLLRVVCDNNWSVRGIDLHVLSGRSKPDDYTALSDNNVSLAAF